MIIRAAALRNQKHDFMWKEQVRILHTRARQTYWHEITAIRYDKLVSSLARYGPLQALTRQSNRICCILKEHCFCFLLSTVLSLILLLILTPNILLLSVTLTSSKVPKIVSDKLANIWQENFHKRNTILYAARLPSKAKYFSFVD